MPVSILRKISSSIQQSIVPWSITMFGYSFLKMQTFDTYREMMIAIIDEGKLLPCHPDCAKEVRAYPVAFNDLVKKVKHAAGMYRVVLRAYFCYSFA